LAQYQVNVGIVKKLNVLRKESNERMDNFAFTTKKISDRLEKIEHEISELRKWQKNDGQE